MNKSLFSGHFLHARLPEMDEWADDPAPVYAALLPLWEKAQRLGSHWNEAQTEAEFIQPVLELLGWSYTVQAKSNRGGQISRPDYALFAPLLAFVADCLAPRNSQPATRNSQPATRNPQLAPTSSTTSSPSWPNR